MSEIKKGFFGMKDISEGLPEEYLKNTYFSLEKGVDQFCCIQDITIHQVTCRRQNEFFPE